MSGAVSRRSGIIQEVFLALLFAATTGLVTRWVFSSILDPNKDNKKAIAAKKAALAKRLGRAVDTTPYEDSVAQEVVNPDDIDVGLDSIGGLDEAKQVLMLKVIEPLRRPELFHGPLLGQSKGVLFYGPPGTGKTMLAKALAKESGARFIALKASTLQNKWFGDTQKLVSALFTLAYKIQPTIIFIDEVDAMLGTRKHNEHEAVTSLKTEFMQLWDGLQTDKSANIVVLGATNRPGELDDAVLRRFSVMHEVGMPDVVGREKILEVIIAKQVEGQGSDSVDPALLSDSPFENGKSILRIVAEMTDGCSGNDLHEICCRAAARPVHEYINSNMSARVNGNNEVYHDATDNIASSYSPRPVMPADLIAVATDYKPSGVQAFKYSDRARRAKLGRATSGQAAPNLSDFVRLLAEATQRPQIENQES